MTKPELQAFIGELEAQRNFLGSRAAQLAMEKAALQTEVTDLRDVIERLARELAIGKGAKRGK